MLFKREPALHSLTAVVFASGIKDSRNWPQNRTFPQSWWEFSFLSPCYLTCHVLTGSPSPLWPQRQFQIFFVCFKLTIYQHVGFLHRQLIVATLGSIISYIQVSLHLVYKNPLQCWDNVNGPHCKWKSSLWFLHFPSKVLCLFPYRKWNRKVMTKKCHPSVSTLRKECLENLCYQSFIIAHKLDLRSIYWIQESIIKKLN